MKKIKAFPNRGYYPDDPNNHLESGERSALETLPQEGMDLRDYFAAKAMQTMVESWAGRDSKHALRVAEEAYKFADAMMKAREGK